jgi:ElaB/YqjD/DUF883 family membrane-anchored ribosome-binding protein
MSKKTKKEKTKPTKDELQKKIEEVMKLTKEYQPELEKRMKEEPLKSAGMIFIIGLILGLILGIATCRRS